MSTRPKLLDLFCGAGGAAMGYHRAGFEVIGVDIHLQPRYPFVFVQADALDFVRRNGKHFDAIHASPPCQQHTSLRARTGKTYMDFVPETRRLLQSTGRPYIIENVPGAPLLNPVILCGSMFGLGTGKYVLRRHRLFESNLSIALGSQCSCRGRRAIGIYGEGARSCEPSPTWAKGTQLTKTMAIEAMGIDWMTNAEMSQAIPPAYTEYLGRQLLAELTQERAA